jgi:hypothetical protein
VRLVYPVLALLAVSATYPAIKAEPEVVDGGTFTLYLRGARIGEERFFIRKEEAGGGAPIYRAGAELLLKLDVGTTMRIGVALETLGSTCQPRRYEAEINGTEAKSIVGTMVRDRIRLDIRSPSGDEMTEFLLRGKAAILDKHIAHHHFFAWKQLDGNPSTEATVLIPREKAKLAATIEDVGLELVELAGAEFELRHITITAEGRPARHVWLDGERVMKVEVPEEGFIAERSDTAS